MVILGEGFFYPTLTRIMDYFFLLTTVLFIDSFIYSYLYLLINLYIYLYIYLLIHYKISFRKLGYNYT